MVCYDLSHTAVSFVGDSIETKRIAALQRTKLFGSLTSDQVADVAQRAVEIHLRKGEMLFLSGEAAKGLFVVIRGKIRAFQQDEDGREQVMHVDAAGAVLGDVPVFDDGPYPASAISEVDADILFIEKNDMRRIVREVSIPRTGSAQVDGGQGQEACKTDGGTVSP